MKVTEWLIILGVSLVAFQLGSLLIQLLAYAWVTR